MQLHLRGGSGIKSFTELHMEVSSIGFPEFIHTYIHTYTLLSIPEKGFSASILKMLKLNNNLVLSTELINVNWPPYRDSKS